MPGDTVASNSAVVRAKAENQWQNVVLGFILLLAVFAAYLPVHHYPFIDLDDDEYVYSNPKVVAPADWKTFNWAFNHDFNGNYAPLDYLSHTLEVQAFQLNPGLHHDTNVLLHALDACLLFWVLLQATGYRWRSLMVAALFALHPINVENVAWISEQKTLLSTLFFLLAMAAYHRYVRDPRQKGMGLVSLMFALGLLAKPQVITLPFVLLLWDYWPLRRMLPRAEDPGEADPAGHLAPRKLSALLHEKIPLFAIALADALLTLRAQKGMENWKYPLYIRLGNAILSYGRYLHKTVWPTHLALMYLHPGYALPWVQVLVAFLFLVTISVLVFLNRSRGYLVVGWLWFLGTSIPTIGVVQISVFALADRYIYVPLIGLLIMICWGAAELAKQLHFPRIIVVAGSLGVLLALSVVTRHQVEYWSGPLTLWTHTLDVTHSNWVAEAHLGDYYAAHGEVEEALAHYQRATADPSSELFICMKVAMLEHQRRDLPQALLYYQRVLAGSTSPELRAQVLANMGHIYNDLGNLADADRCYRESQRLAATVPASTPD